MNTTDLGQCVDEGFRGPAGILEIGGLVECVRLVEVVGWVEQVLGQI